MDISLKIATENDASLWDQIVDSSPEGTIFHSWKWLKIAEKHTNTRLYPIMGLKGETIFGILPLFHMKKYGVSAAFSPPPSTAIPYMGPVFSHLGVVNQGKKESTEKTFLSYVDHYIFSQLKCGYSLHSLTMYHDPRPYKWAGYTLQPIFDFHLDIGQDITSIWNNMTPNFKKDVRRAEKHGISVQDGSEKDLLDIYNSLFQRYKEQGRSVTISMNYLLELYKAFSPENFKIFVAKNNGETIGGMIIIFYKHYSVGWVGTAKQADSKSSFNFSPNDIAQWEAIKYAHSRDCTIYEIIGAGTERLSKYKSKFNPRLVSRFSAKKYSSVAYQIMETGYSTILKNTIRKLV